MADALRRDFFPELPGTTVETIAQGSNTPTGFTAMLTGVLPQAHGVFFFQQAIDGMRENGRQKSTCKVPTIFDLEQMGYDVSYYDHPHDPMYKVLNNPPKKELAELKEPFVYVERETATHVIYGRNWRTDNVKIEGTKDGRMYEDMRGRDYIQLMREGKVDYISDYKKGVQIATDRLYEFVDILKQMGLYENTLVVLTSDHGEAFPNDRRRGIIHNVVCPEVVNIKTNFFDRNIEVKEPLLSKDIIKGWEQEWQSVQRQLETSPEKKRIKKWAVRSQSTTETLPKH